MIPDRSHDPERVSWDYCNGINTTITTSSNAPAATNASKHARHDSGLGKSAVHPVTSSEQGAIDLSEEADPPLFEPVISEERASLVEGTHQCGNGYLSCSLRGGATTSETTKRLRITERQAVRPRSRAHNFFRWLVSPFNKPGAMPIPHVLFFDVFGTCVDWRTTITAQLHAECRLVLDNPKATLGMSDLDKTNYESMTPARWAQFAQSWRDSYMGFCSYQSKTPSSPFITVDQHHRRSLRRLLGEWGLADLWPTDEDIVRISDHWHRLDGWLDTTVGLSRLHQLCATVTLTNGNNTLVSDLRKHAHMAFDRLLCAEDFEAYKPSAAVYDGGVRLMKVHPQQCMMVAAHLGDLKAANSRGMQTAYIDRDGEEKASPQEVEEARSKWLDYYIPLEKGNPEGGFVRLAAELEARGATSRDPIFMDEEVEGVTPIPKTSND